jgi:hypothetical protein
MTVVKGAGRRRHLANAKHAQRTPLPPKEGVQRSPADLLEENAETRAIVMGRRTPSQIRADIKAKKAAQEEKSPEKPSGPQSEPVLKSRTFFLYAEAAGGWEVAYIEKENHHIVRAVSGEEIVEAEWSLNGKRNDGLGIWVDASWSYPGGHRRVNNASTARKIIDAKPGNFPPPSARRVGVKRDPVKKARSVAATDRLPFNVETAPDTEVLAAIAGKKVSWLNSITDEIESGRVPATSKSTKIHESRADGSLGERILTFCDVAEGFRSCYVSQIVRVSR